MISSASRTLFRCKSMSIPLGLTIICTMAAAAEPQMTSDDPTIDPAKVIETIRSAAQNTRNGLKSVTGKGWFKNWLQTADQDEPQLMSDGKLHTYVEDGKFHLRFSHDKHQEWTVLLPEGVDSRPGEPDVYRNQAGEIVEVPVELIDSKMESMQIVFDGKKIHRKIFWPANRNQETVITPQNSFQNACSIINLKLPNPTYLAGYHNPETVQSPNIESMQISRLPDNGYGVTIRFKTAPQMKMEVDAFEKDGFNMSASRVIHDGKSLPESEIQLTWKKFNDQWVVTKLSKEEHRPESKRQKYSKEIVGYHSIEMNQWIDPIAFTQDSLGRKWKPRSSPDSADPAAEFGTLLK